MIIYCCLSRRHNILADILVCRKLAKVRQYLDYWTNAEMQGLSIEVLTCNVDKDNVSEVYSECLIMSLQLKSCLDEGKVAPAPLLSNLLEYF